MDTRSRPELRSQKPDTQSASEYGIAIQLGIHSIPKRVPDIPKTLKSFCQEQRRLLRRLNDHTKELCR